MALRFFCTVVAFSIVYFSYSMHYVREELSAARVSQIKEFTSKMPLAQQAVEEFNFNGNGETLEQALQQVEAEKEKIDRDLSDDDDLVYNEVMRELDKLIYGLAKSYRKHKDSLQLSHEIKARLQTLGVVL